MTSPNSSRTHVGAMRRKVATATLVGTTIEWYDFFIYGTAAALVFGQIFFPSFSPIAGTLAAFATYAVGFFARPVGGIIAGHFGDRVGRKAVLVVSLVTMGAATALVGVLPTYDTIGVAAPILLVVLRFVQGLGVGGEWGGAVLMASEHATEGRRGLFASFPQMGLPAGIILANAAFYLVNSNTTPAQLLDWGWRIPFLVGGLLVIVGLLIRLRVEESPDFAAVREAGTVARVPVIEAIRDHPRLILLGGAASIAAPVLGYIVSVYMLSYGVMVLQLPNTTMLGLITLSSVLWLGAIAVAGVLADRHGRRPVFSAGALLGVAWSFPFFALVNTGSPGLVGLALVVAVIAVGLMLGAQAAFLAELFAPRIRYSAVSTAFQIGVLVGGAPAPLIATALYAEYGSSVPISVYMFAMCLITLVSVRLLPETVRHSPVATSAGVPTTEVSGRRAAAGSNHVVSDGGADR